MSNREIRIFYSWQSDLPGGNTRNLIQDSIKDAVRLLRDTVAIEADRDTKGEFGAPDIVQTIFSKIDECDIFIADVSAVCEYSPLDKDGKPTNEIKLAPNPNVLIELGYAAHVIGWENIILVINTDYGSPKQMPFDIEHHRLTPYSLKEKSKGEAKRYIRDIIQATVENLLNNGLRVKPHFSNIRVGAYNAESKELCTSLVPWSIQTGQAFRNYKHAVIAECMSLIDDIQKIDLKPRSKTPETPTEISSEIEQEPIVTPDGRILTPVKPKFQLDLFMTYAVEIPEDTIQDIIHYAKLYLDYDIDSQSNFFNIGDLRKRNTFDPFSSFELVGSDDEKEKYGKICELGHKLLHLRISCLYLDTFDGLLLFPLAVINDSTVSDENITVSLQVNTSTAEIVTPTEQLIHPKLQGLEDIVYEEGVIKDFLMMAENSDIKYDSDISISSKDLFPDHRSIGYLGGINGAPRYDSEDYVDELAKYIAEPIEGTAAEFTFTISSLHAKEKKWLGAAILVKPISDTVEITYTIKSRSSDGNLSGMMVYSKE